jgi:hypothetical protein
MKMIVLQILLPVLMLLHGIAHLPGVLTSWRLAVFADAPYHTAVLGRRLDVGDAGMRVLGALWLAAGLGLMLSAVGAVIHHEQWLALALASTLLSTMLCTLEYPAAHIGWWTNAALLSGLVIVARSTGS